MGRRTVCSNSATRRKVTARLAAQPAVNNDPGNGNQHFVISPSRVKTVIRVRLDLVLTLFFKQELAHFSNHQCFVHYENVVVGVMQFDDSRFSTRAEAPHCAFYPLASDSMLRSNFSWWRGSRYQ